MAQDDTQQQRQPSFDILRQLYEAMSDGVAAFDSNGRIVFCNPAMGLLVGAKCKELIGLTASEAWGGERIELPDETASTGGQFILHCRDGSQRIVTVKSFFLRTEPPLQVAIYRDITRWRTTEHMLRALIGTSLQQGREMFLRQVVIQLARVLAVPYAFLGTLDEEDPKLLHVEACWVRDELGSPFACRLEGGPCENLKPGSLCYYSRHVWQLFPGDEFIRTHRIETFLGAPLVDAEGRVRGVIAALDTRPLAAVYDSRTLISIFAAYSALGLTQFEATRELRETQERYDALVEQAREGFYLRDLVPVRILVANRTLQKMFGYTEEELKSLHPLEAVAPEVRERVGRLVAKMIETRRPHILRFIALRKDGSRFTAELLPTFVTYRGRPCLQATVRDVTEKVRVEQERRLLGRLALRLAGDDTIERISATVQEITQELFDWDAYCFVVRQPGNRRRVIEYVDTVEGVRQVFPGTIDPPESLSGPMRRALAGESVLIDVAEHGAEPTLRPFGDVEHRSQTLLYVPIRLPDGVIGVISIQSYHTRRYTQEDLGILQRVADVVAPALQRARAEHQVRESEERYRKLVEQAPVAILVLQNGLIKYVNPAGVQLLGASSNEDLLDVRFLDFVSDSLKPLIEERLARAISQVAALPSIEFEIRRFDGRALTIEAREIPTSYKDSPALQVVLQDVTQQKEALRRIQRSEQQLKLLFEQTPLGIIRWSKDFCVEEWNPGAERIFGYSRNEALGRHAFDLIVPPPVRDFVQQVWDNLLTQKGGTHAKNVNLRKDGHPVVCCWYNTPLVSPDGTVIGVASIVEDVTERERMADALRESEERFSLAVLGSNDAIWDWDIRGEKLYLSPRWNELLGLAGEEQYTTIEEWLKCIDTQDREAFRKALAAHLSGATPQLAAEFRALCSNGQQRWILCRGLAVRDSTGTPVRMAGSLSDLTPRKKAEEQLLFDALHDGLTKLANRTLMLEHVEHSIGITRREFSYAFAILLLDIDRFKLINDSHGHRVGDELLCAVATAFEKALRPGDVLGRLSGDEFFVLFDDIRDRQQAEQLAEELLSVFDRPFRLSVGDIYVTASGGLVMSDSSYASAEEMLRDADTAMFRAKALGGHRVEVFTPEMRLRAQSRLQLETDLRRAVQEQQFDLLFQPIVCLMDSTVWGFESIVRWRHPLRGMLLPLEFLAVAEETGLILDVGDYVLRRGCAQLADWLKADPASNLALTINMSARQLQEPIVFEQLENVLRETGVPPRLLVIEVTESIFLDEHEQVSSALNSLRERGLRLAVDDFGSGYSSFGYLQRLPVDLIKIDHMFVSSLGTPRERPEILQTIVNLGRTLGVQLVAEGVENEMQAAHLRELGVPFVQGFLFGPPMPAAAAWEFARSRRQ
ncbi:MAG: PAS domain S-box protein [Candidatus Sumerlaeaceae bacterium]